MDEQNANPTEFDVIVWGATGFTGKIVVEYLYQRYGNQTDQLAWAIAGRDAGKLQSVVTRFLVCWRMARIERRWIPWFRRPGSC